MTIFGIGPESFWFWILCAAGSWALVLMVRVAGAVIASLRDDLRAIRNPPEGELWEAAMEDRVRQEHKDQTCTLQFATESTLSDETVTFIPINHDHGLTEEQVEALKDEVHKRRARAAHAELESFRVEVVRQLWRKLGNFPAVLQVLDTSEYPTSFIKRVIGAEGVDPLTLGPTPVSWLKDEERKMPDAWPPENES